VLPGQHQIRIGVPVWVTAIATMNGWAGVTVREEGLAAEGTDLWGQDRDDRVSAES
jgi:hypothetical protein